MGGEARCAGGRPSPYVIVTVTVLRDDTGDCLAPGEDFILWRGGDIGRGVVTRRVFV